MLRVRDIHATLIFMSDGTRLSNFAGDKKEWHVYTTIGNLSWMISQMLSIHCVIPWIVTVPSPYRPPRQPPHHTSKNGHQRPFFLSSLL